VITALPPIQIADGEADAVTVGFGTTVTRTVFWPMQPCALVPLTVYVVEIVGARFWLPPPKLPGFQLNVIAPVAAIFTEFPEQMLADAGVSVMAGGGEIEILTVPGVVLTHPFVPVPLTE
jgi:hypothetical protein